MTPYSSRSGKKTGVSAYDIGKDFIIVQFNRSDLYKYSYQSCGRKATEAMKSLALASKGLSTFISQNQPKYDE
jgi:hypothetical protein